MKDITLFSIGFAAGAFVAAAFYEKVKALIVRLLTKTASKIEGK